MPVIAQDIIDLSQVVMNVQASAIDGTRGGDYSPTGPITFHSGGLTARDGAVFEVEYGGYFNIASYATVNSNAAAAWGGQYTYANAILDLDGNSFVFSHGTVWAGFFCLGDGATHIATLSLFAGSSIGIGVNADIQNAGVIDNNTSKGHMRPFIGKLADPGGTTPSHYVPYATAALVPEIISITMSGADSVIDIPAGADRQHCTVTVGAESSSYAIEIHFLRAGGGESGVVTLKNASGSVLWADLWCDGTNWLLISEGKVA
jgi:hypothetical protein